MCKCSLFSDSAIVMEHENPCEGELSHIGKDILDQAALELSSGIQELSSDELRLVQINRTAQLTK